MRAIMQNQSKTQIAILYKMLFFQRGIWENVLSVCCPHIVTFRETCNKDLSTYGMAENVIKRK